MYDIDQKKKKKITFFVLKPYQYARQWLRSSYKNITLQPLVTMLLTTC